MSRFVVGEGTVDCLYCGEPMMALAKDDSFQLEGLVAAEASHDCSVMCPHCGRQL